LVVPPDIDKRYLYQVENQTEVTESGNSEEGTRYIIHPHSPHSGMGSSVGTATDYGLDGPGIKARWGRDFSHTSRPALGPTQPPVQWVPGLSRGVKRPGRGADHPPPSRTEVENE
jgi:hypothetical protein